VDDRELEMVDRLCASSRDRAVALGSPMPWPEARDRDGWYTSPELLSLHGTAAAAGLSDARLRELAFFEALNFYSLNIHGERLLLQGLAARLHRKDFARISGYLHHFLDEENKHLCYFGTFCMRYGGKIYPHVQLAFPRDHAPGEEDVLFFAKVLVFEEIVDHYNRAMARDARLAPIAREINRLHHLDEARHLAFGRLLVKDLLARHAPSWSPETLAGVRATLAAFVEAMWRQYYNPEVYRDAGLANPHDLARAAFASPAAHAHRAAASRRCLAFLGEAGILPDGASA
jgi:hypothetical protein